MYIDIHTPRNFRIRDILTFMNIYHTYIQLLIGTIVKRKKDWIGHVLRGNGKLKEIIEGRMERKRGRGRKRIDILNFLLEGGSYATMKSRALDRVAWRK